MRARNNAVKALLDARADPNAFPERVEGSADKKPKQQEGGAAGKTVKAKRKGVKKGMEEGKRERRSMSPLALACVLGKPDFLETLLAAGAKLDLFQPIDQTAVREETRGIAADGKFGESRDLSERRMACVRLLLERVQPCMSSDNPFAVLYQEEVDGLLSHVCAIGCVPVVEELLKAKADPDFIGQDVRLPTIFHALGQKKHGCLRLLLEYGVGLSARCKVEQGVDLAPAQFALQRMNDKEAFRIIMEKALRGRKLVGCFVEVKYSRRMPQLVGKSGKVTGFDDKDFVCRVSIPLERGGGPQTLSLPPTAVVEIDEPEDEEESESEVEPEEEDEASRRSRTRRRTRLSRRSRTRARTRSWTRAEASSSWSRWATPRASRSTSAATRARMTRSWQLAQPSRASTSRTTTQRPSAAMRRSTSSWRMSSRTPTTTAPSPTGQPITKTWRRRSCVRLTRASARISCSTSRRVLIPTSRLF